MRKLFGLLLLLGVLFRMSPAGATVRIDIDLTTQTMHVDSAAGHYDWPISSARAGYVTPRGTFHPISLQAMHYSRKYQMSPMPHSIFFAGGLAIHGTYETATLGEPASHGCVRISPDNAAVLYQMVEAEGATITISGTPPLGRVYASGQYRPGASSYDSPQYWGPSSMRQWFNPFGR